MQYPRPTHRYETTGAICNSFDPINSHRHGMFTVPVRRHKCPSDDHESKALVTKLTGLVMSGF